MMMMRRRRRTRTVHRFQTRCFSSWGCSSSSRCRNITQRAVGVREAVSRRKLAAAERRRRNTRGEGHGRSAEMRRMHRRVRGRHAGIQCLPAEERVGRVGESYTASSIWELKPPWCQPWTIVSSGVILTVIPGELASFILHRGCMWPSVVAGLLVCAWWYLFLYIYPRQVAAILNAQLEDDDNTK